MQPAGVEHSRQLLEDGPMGKRNSGRYPAHLLCHHCGTGVSAHARSVTVMDGNVKRIYHDVCARKARKLERQRERRAGAEIRRVPPPPPVDAPPPPDPPPLPPLVAEMALIPPAPTAPGVRPVDPERPLQRIPTACPACHLGRTKVWVHATEGPWYIRACVRGHWFLHRGTFGTQLRVDDAKRLVAWMRATRHTHGPRPCPLCGVAVDRPAVADHIVGIHAMPKARTKLVRAAAAPAIAVTGNGELLAEAVAAVSRTGFSADHLEKFVENGRAAQAAVDARTPPPDLDDALLNADVALKTLWSAMLAEFRREMATLLDARLPR